MEMWTAGTCHRFGSFGIALRFFGAVRNLHRFLPREARTEHEGAVARSNAKIAGLLRQYAGALAVAGANRFKVKAYRRAADTLESLEPDVAEFVARGEDLKQLPAIGDAISRTIEDIVNTGRMPQLDRAMADMSPEIAELASRPRLDAKKVQRVYKKLNIGSLAEL